MENITEALKTFNFLIAFSVLIVYTITDALYARYTLDVANYNAVKAASIGSLIHFFLAFGVINYTQNWLYIFPLAIGSWLGTYFTIKKAKLNKAQRQT